MTCTCEEAVLTAYKQLRDKGFTREDALQSTKTIIRLRHQDMSDKAALELAEDWTRKGAEH